jgi:catechol 2,3-dioxygenase-like lactoylglutathione lyase family enzyme
MTRLHHLALGARDVLRVAAFYRDVLRLSEVARHFDEHGVLRSVWLDLGGALLMLERTLEDPRCPIGVAAGPFLVALRVAPGERRSVEAALEAAGAPIESRTLHSSYTRDPEGNRVAISHYPLDSLELEAPADVGSEVSE